MSDADSRTPVVEGPKISTPATTWVNGSRQPKCDWNALWADYETGQFSLRALSAKYGVDDGLISRKARKLGKVNTFQVKRPTTSAASIARAERAAAAGAVSDGEKAQEPFERKSLADSLATVSGTVSGGSAVVGADRQQAQVIVKDDGKGPAVEAIKAAVESTPDAVGCLVAVMNGQIVGKGTDARRRAAVNLLEFVTETTRAPPAPRRLGELSPGELRELRDKLREQERVIDGEAQVIDDAKPLSQQPQQPD